MNRYKEVYSLARESKAWMLRHLRRHIPRSDVQKELIAKEKGKPLWKYVSDLDILRTRAKRLSKKQHFEILQKMRGCG